MNSPITQVSKEDVQDGKLIVYPSKNQPLKKKGFFQSLFFCCVTVPGDETQDNKPYMQSKRLSNDYLLPHPRSEDVGRKTLVLDLDETLVHSSFKPISNADFIIPVEIEGQTHHVYVLKRPGVDKFMKWVGEHFEVVVFTASLSKYADPVLDLLDIHKVVRSRLFREACVEHKGNFVKDLSRLGRELKNSIIIDNSPMSYLFHPDYAVPIGTWFDEPNDTELLDLIPMLLELTKVDDVCTILDKSKQRQ